MTAPAPRDPSFGRDIASAYLASASRIGSWVIVSAAVYRFLGPAEFAMLALVRGTIGILNYVTLGLAPALIHRGAHNPQEQEPIRDASSTGSEQVLSYYAPDVPNTSLSALHASAMLIAYAAGAAGFVLNITYALFFNRLYHIPVNLNTSLPALVLLMGTGTLLRLVGDAPGAVLQVRGHIAFDNRVVALGEILWAVTAFMACSTTSRGTGVVLVGACYALSGLVAFLIRVSEAGRETGVQGLRRDLINATAIKLLMSYGSLVVVAQLADYLYAPTDYILIARLLHPIDLANYAPAVQIDAGLFLLVTGLSAVLLPKTAVAHAAGSSQVVRSYYVLGTLASLAMLAVASAIIWAASPLIFRLWLGNTMPGTRAILPLVLVNTVLGGSSAVGRSILLAVGKVKPFTIAALASGVVNVACSYAFVRFLDLGLKGIVLGTVIAVVGRCVLWMPWYVLHTIRKSGRITLPTADPTRASY